MSANAAHRLMRRCVEDGNGCWIFEGAKNNRGYGVIGVGGNGQTALTHRVAYEHSVSPIPDGLVLDHLCRNRACCNPWHLEPVTPLVNSNRGLRAAGYAEPECSNGHAYTPENTGRNQRGRVCLTCRAASRQRETAKRKGVAA